MLEWGKLAGIESKDLIEKTLRRLIRGDTYGSALGEWSVTELVQERSNHASIASRIIQGIGLDGRATAHPPVTSVNGGPLMITLKVLTRQACMMTVEGKPINMWDTTETTEINYNGELCPNEKDKPMEGDQVWIKGQRMTVDPETGDPLKKEVRLRLRARYEAEHGYAAKAEVAFYHWHKYTVNKDGCITVTYDHALQLLKNKGKRIVLPQWTESRRGKKPREGRRLITNWHFEEVLPEKKTKRRAKNEQPFKE